MILSLWSVQKSLRLMILALKIDRSKIKNWSALATAAWLAIAGHLHPRFTPTIYTHDCLTKVIIVSSGGQYSRPGK